MTPGSRELKSWWCASAIVTFYPVCREWGDEQVMQGIMCLCSGLVKLFPWKSLASCTNRTILYWGHASEAWVGNLVLLAEAGDHAALTAGC